MADITDILAKATPAQVSVRVCVDGSISGRLEQLTEQLLEAGEYDDSHNEAGTAQAVQDQIDALQVEAEAATVEFKVRSVGSRTWRQLLQEHPPGPDDEGWLFDTLTFPAAAAAACCADPVMTEDQAAELADTLSNAQWGKLFGAVLSTNMSDDLPKFGGGTGGPRRSVPNSTTAPPEGSLTESS